MSLTGEATGPRTWPCPTCSLPLGPHAAPYLCVLLWSTGRPGTCPWVSLRVPLPFIFAEMSLSQRCHLAILCKTAILSPMPYLPMLPSVFPTELTADINFPCQAVVSSLQIPSPSVQARCLFTDVALHLCTPSLGTESKASTVFTDLPPTPGVQQSAEGHVVTANK